MKTLTRNILLVVAGILAIFLARPDDILARDLTVVGEINDQNELVSSEDGTVYEIAESEIGDKLINEHRGETVRVFGTLLKAVQESSVDELPKGLIKVISFEDVPE
jgi:hypothetical protein